MLERLLRRVLKLPPDPEVSADDATSTTVFRAAKGYYRYRLIKWVITQLWTAVGIVVGLYVFTELPGKLQVMLGRWVVVVEALTIAGFIGQLLVGWHLVGLDYRLRWYFLSSDGLRIREGLAKLREQTVRFANVQNVSIRQGPLQRRFGIADLEIQTAGGGDGGELDEKEDDLHLAVFRGVDNAEDIRDLVRAELARLKGAGLGDDPAPEDEPSSSEPGDLLVAARELADAAEGLRGSLPS
ncbi:MAG: PH domain-containing protein [Acidobacteriota bacterium]